jgi:hypothetical protein
MKLLRMTDDRFKEIYNTLISKSAASTYYLSFVHSRPAYKVKLLRLDCLIKRSGRVITLGEQVARPAHEPGF